MARNKLIFVATLFVLGLSAGYFLESSDSSYARLASKDASGEAEILFVGDIMLDRTLRKIGEARGYDHIFSCIEDYLSGFDLVVGNLEGPVTLHGSVSRGTKPGEPGNTTFTFAPESVDALARANIGLVNLGNNHIWDFGSEGAEATKAFLDEAGISHFGDPKGSIAATVEIGGNSISVISFNQFLGMNDPQRTIEAIWKAGRTSDIVVVYAHWGDEYVPATEYQKALAHRFIDAGADLVVGSHPHVIQESEIYNGKYIYYSLGNFIFDQYWVEEVRTGLGLEVSVKDGKASIKERRLDIQRGGATCLSR